MLTPSTISLLNLYREAERTIAFMLCLGAAGLTVPHIAHAASCDAVVGKWAWFVGGEVTINPDGTFTQKSGNSGTWECLESAKGAVALKWKQGGYLNRLALADGGTKLVSTDPSQSFVKATRINPETALTDLLAPRRETIGDSSSSRRPSGQPGGTVPIKPSTPLTKQKGPAPFDSPQGFVSSDPKVEARFKQGYDLFTRKNYSAAFPILMEVAQAGHLRAQALLGRTYLEGLGQAVDYKQAAEWYGKAAAQGHRAALFSLGNLYLVGDGVPKDQVKAIQLYLQSAHQGFSDAEFHIGVAYEFGWGGLPRDRRMAIKWLDRASRHKQGQAGWILTWLEDPKTPHFRDFDQLGNYIGGIIDRRVNAALSAGIGSPASSSPSSGSSSGGGCSYTSYGACNAEKAGDRWAAERIERGSASGSERDWYGR